MPSNIQQLMGGSGVQAKLDALRQQGYTDEHFLKAAQATFGQAPDPGNLYSDRADIFQKLIGGTDKAYEDAREPYEASTLDKILKYGGLAAGAAGVLGLGSNKTSNALAGLGGAAVGRSMGAPGRDRAGKVATRDDALAQLMSTSNAALNQNTAGQAQYDNELKRFGINTDNTQFMMNNELDWAQLAQRQEEERRRRNAANKSGGPTDAELRARREEAERTWTEGGKMGAALTKPAYQNLEAATKAEYPNWWKKVTKGKGGASPEYETIKGAADRGSIGSVTEDKPGWWTGDTTYANPTFQQAMGGVGQSKIDSAQVQGGQYFPDHYGGNPPAYGPYEQYRLGGGQQPMTQAPPQGSVSRQQAQTAVIEKYGMAEWNAASEADREAAIADYMAGKL